MKKRFLFRGFHDKTPLRFCEPGHKPTKSKMSPSSLFFNYRPMQDMHWAASVGNVDVMLRIIKQGFVNVWELDSHHRTPLHYASAYGRAEAVSMLLHYECKIDVCDDQGATPLMKAVQGQQEECVAILLKSGAQVNYPNVKGFTPLHYAIYHRDPRIAELLLEHNADLELRTKEGYTPLLLAIKELRHQMAMFFIEKGANIHICDSYGRTALMYAVKCDSECVVTALLQQGIDVHCKDVHGWNAVRYAVEGHRDVRKILLNYNESTEENKWVQGEPQKAVTSGEAPKGKDGSENKQPPRKPSNSGEPKDVTHLVPVKGSNLKNVENKNVKGEAEKAVPSEEVPKGEDGSENKQPLKSPSKSGESKNVEELLSVVDPTVNNIENKRVEDFSGDSDIETIILEDPKPCGDNENNGSLGKPTLKYVDHIFWTAEEVVQNIKGQKVEAWAEECPALKPTIEKKVPVVEKVIEVTTVQPFISATDLHPPLKPGIGRKFEECEVIEVTDEESLKSGVTKRVEFSEESDIEATSLEVPTPHDDGESNGSLGRHPKSLARKRLDHSFEAADERGKDIEKQKVTEKSGIQSTPLEEPEAFDDSENDEALDRLWKSLAQKRVDHSFEAVDERGKDTEERKVAEKSGIQSTPLEEAEPFDDSENDEALVHTNVVSNLHMDRLWKSLAQKRVDHSFEAVDERGKDTEERKVAEESAIQLVSVEESELYHDSENGKLLGSCPKSDGSFDAADKRVDDIEKQKVEEESDIESTLLQEPELYDQNEDESLGRHPKSLPQKPLDHSFEAADETIKDIEKGKVAERNESMENELIVLERKLSETKEVTSQLEHEKVEQDPELCSLRITLKGEAKERGSALDLHEKTQEQLREKEEQFDKEIEVREQLEIHLRTPDTESKSLTDDLNQLQEQDGNTETPRSAQKMHHHQQKLELEDTEVKDTQKKKSSKLFWQSLQNKGENVEGSSHLCEDDMEPQIKRVGITQPLKQEKKKSFRQIEKEVAESKKLLKEAKKKLKEYDRRESRLSSYPQTAQIDPEIIMREHKSEDDTEEQSIKLVGITQSLEQDKETRDQVEKELAESRKLLQMAKMKLKECYSSDIDLHRFPQMAHLDKGVNMLRHKLQEEQDGKTKTPRSAQKTHHHQKKLEVEDTQLKYKAIQKGQKIKVLQENQRSKHEVWGTSTDLSEDNLVQQNKFVDLARPLEQEKKEKKSKRFLERSKEKLNGYESRECRLPEHTQLITEINMLKHKLLEEQDRNTEAVRSAAKMQYHLKRIELENSELRLKIKKQAENFQKDPQNFGQKQWEDCKKKETKLAQIEKTQEEEKMHNNKLQTQLNVLMHEMTELKLKISEQAENIKQLQKDQRDKQTMSGDDRKQPNEAVLLKQSIEQMKEQNSELQKALTGLVHEMTDLKLTITGEAENIKQPQKDQRDKQTMSGDDREQPTEVFKLEPSIEQMKKEDSVIQKGLDINKILLQRAEHKLNERKRGGFSLNSYPQTAQFGTEVNMLAHEWEEAEDWNTEGVRSAANMQDRLKKVEHEMTELKLTITEQAENIQQLQKDQRDEQTMSDDDIEQPNEAFKLEPSIEQMKKEDSVIQKGLDICKVLVERAEQKLNACKREFHLDSYPQKAQFDTPINMLGRQSQEAQDQNTEAVQRAEERQDHDRSLRRPWATQDEWEREWMEVQRDLARLTPWRSLETGCPSAGYLCNILGHNRLSRRESLVVSTLNSRPSVKSPQN